MKTKFSPARCCCAKPPDKDGCPCLDGTLTVANELTITGITHSLLASSSGLNLNTTITSSQWQVNDAACRVGYGVQILPNSGQSAGWSFGVNFTRNDVFLWAGNTEVELPAGVKCVVSILATIVNPFRGGLLVAEKVAFFHKVLPDSDGFSDCGASLSGFTFNVQYPQFGTDYVFDASAGSLTYS